MSVVFRQRSRARRRPDTLVKRLLAALFLIVLATPADTQEIGQMPVSFEQFQRRSTPNDYLVCPADFCRAAAPDRIAPMFDMPAADLRNRIEAMVASMPRTRIVTADDTHLVVEQRSLIFRFPDYIDVRAIAVGEDASTIAIYSRSKYGSYDFGVNKRRVERWLRGLE